MASVLARWTGRSCLTFRKLKPGRAGLSKMVSDPALGSHSSLLYRTEEFEITCSVCQSDLTDVSEWCRTSPRQSSVDADESTLTYFVAHISHAGVPDHPQAIEIESLCDSHAMRKEIGLEVLLSCERHAFLSVACLWSESLLRYKKVFEVVSLQTVTLGDSFCANLRSGQTPRTPLSALEKLCLDDIVAARHISDNVTAAFPPDPDTGSENNSPIENLRKRFVTEEAIEKKFVQEQTLDKQELEEMQAGNLPEIPRFELSCTEEATSSGNDTGGRIGKARGLSVDDSNDRQRSLSSEPTRVGERRYSVAISHPHSELDRSRLSLTPLGASMHRGLNVSPSLLSSGGIRRFTKRRASSIAKNDRKVPQKPPNILIYSGEHQQIFQRLASVVEECIPTDSHTVYRLSLDNLVKDPWAEQTACLLIAETESLTEGAWERLQNYFQKGGRMLFVCQNRLLSSLTECKSVRKRTNMLKRACSINSGALPLGKDFETFLKKVCKKMNNKEILEKLHAKDLTTGCFYSIYAVKENNSPLLLYMQNGVLKAGALFTDATIEAILAAGSTLVREALERLGMKLNENIGELAKFSPGYLFLSDQVHQRDLDTFLGAGELAGWPKIRFSHGRADTIEADESFLPVYMDFREHAQFDTEAYFASLESDKLGQTVLFVPVLTSTMDVMQTCISNLPKQDGMVVIAGHQTKGKGRGGNKWLSPAGCAMFSFSQRFSLQSRLGRAAGYLQHLLALAVADGVCSLPGHQDLPLRIKWPNDIYYGRQHKLGGVIVNCTVTGTDLVCTLGCGINVSNSHPTVCINDMLADDLPPLCSEKVIAVALSRFEQLVYLFQKQGSTTLLPLYYGYWLHSREEVTLSESDEKAVIRGLDEHGYLEVRTARGRLVSLHPDGNSFDMMKNLIRAK